MRVQRATRNLGLNRANTREASYKSLEATRPTSKCTDSKHEGDRILPVRKFYLNGSQVQGACITCQKNYRADRIKRCRQRFIGKTKAEIFDTYISSYGPTKKCSCCKVAKPPYEFMVSYSMETGLHNQCTDCATGNSQASGDRDYIFLPDKDNIKYTKKDDCERCGGTNRLAVDHILPIAKGGTDCIQNKQTLCIHCNCKKSCSIEGKMLPEYVCERYLDDTLDFTCNTTLGRVLASKVSEFKQQHILSASATELRTLLYEYKQKHNLGHNVERMVSKIRAKYH